MYDMCIKDTYVVLYEVVVTRMNRVREFLSSSVHRRPAYFLQRSTFNINKLYLEYRQ